MPECNCLGFWCCLDFWTYFIACLSHPFQEQDLHLFWNQVYMSVLAGLGCDCTLVCSKNSKKRGMGFYGISPFEIFTSDILCGLGFFLGCYCFVSSFLVVWGFLLFLFWLVGWLSFFPVCKCWYIYKYSNLSFHFPVVIKTMKMKKTK